MTERVPLSEWDRVVDALRQFAGSASVTEEEDRVRIDFRSAHVEVTRDGRVETGMPLHEFERTDAADLVVDHDAGELTVEGKGVAYTFRRP